MINLPALKDCTMEGQREGEKRGGEREEGMFTVMGSLLGSVTMATVLGSVTMVIVLGSVHHHGKALDCSYSQEKAGRKEGGREPEG